MFLLRQPGATSMPNKRTLDLYFARLKKPPLFFRHLRLRGTSQDSSPTGGP